MAPTLDEYERILDQPLTNNPPYLYQGNFLSWGRMAKLLKTTKFEVFLEEGKWEDFINLFGLAIYGIFSYPT
ncbi:hypothetical protein CR513_09253, partial [Mucuna pruriens]